MSESSAPPPTKRQGTDDLGCSQDLPDIRRSETLWFKDGSVILQAEMTQFRVHSSMLSRQSTVFADMFSIPQPENEPLIEGCPIVHLSDTAKDVEEVLNILYDNLWFYKHGEACSFSTIAAAVRLGRKYEIDHIRNEALRRLKAEHPSALRDWNRSSEWYTLIADQGGLVFDIIDLAFENNIQSILPVAYLFVVGRGFDFIFSGEEREDGTMATLSSAVLLTCIKAREKLVAALPSHSLRFLKTPGLIPCDICISPNKCNTARGTLLALLWGSTPNPESYLCEWHHLKETFGKRLCPKCMDVAEIQYTSGTETLWQALPTFFGLPEWKDLKDFES